MKPKDCTWLGAAIGIAALSASPAFAQTSPLIIDRGRLDRPQDKIAPAEPPPTLRGRTALDNNAPDDAGVTLKSVQVRGSSLLPRAYARAWDKLIGVPLDRNAVAAAADALSTIYQKSDVALFTILAPVQDLNDGQLDLIVVEGHITDVVIQTDKPDAKDIDLARRYAEKLTKEKPLRRVTLERYMSLIRDIPGEKIDAQLVPSADRGGARLVITAHRKDFDFGFGVNNRGAPLLGRTQATLDASYNGALRGGDQTTASLAAPVKDDRFIYVSLAHSTPLGANGVRLGLSASKLKTRLESGIKGDAETGGFSLSYPILRGYTKNAYASFGFDALDSSNAAFGQALDSSNTRTLRGSVSYSKNSAVSALGASASVSRGLDAWGASVNPFMAQADYTKFGLSAGWDRLFAKRYALRLRGSAQITDDILPASEQFALGGETFGRAYEGAVVQGDQGYGGSVEAALRLYKLLPDWMENSEAYVFGDTGKVRLNAREFFFPDLDFSLSSAGLGARVAVGKKTMLGLEFAQGLDAPYPGVDNEWRVSYSVTSRH